MKKLTRKQRAWIYLKVADIISVAVEFDRVAFICNEINSIQKSGYYTSQLIEIFPELALTIKDESGFSWNDYNGQSMQDDTVERVYALLLSYQMCINP